MKLEWTVQIQIRVGLAIRLPFHDNDIRMKMLPSKEVKYNKVYSTKRTS